LARELGHVVLGRLNGFTITSFGLGFGRPLLIRQWKGIRFFICVNWISGGLTLAYHPLVFVPTRNTVFSLAGGACANVILSLIFLLLWLFFPWASYAWLLAAIVNAIFVVASLVPMKTKLGAFTLSSDGYLILCAIRGKPLQSAPARINAARVLRRFLTAIGDDVSRFIWQVSGALAWLEIGSVEQALLMYQEVTDLPTKKTATLEALEAYLRASIAVEAGQIEASEEARGDVEQYARSVSDELATALDSMLEIALKLKQGTTESTAGAFDTLASEPLIRTHAELRIEVAVARLLARANLPFSADLEPLRLAYEAKRHGRTATSHDLQVYGSLGRYYARRQEWASAESAFGHFLTAVEEMHNGFRNPSDQKVFLTAQSPRIEEARQCLRRLGKDEEEERIATRFASPESLKQAHIQSQKDKSRPYYRRAVMVTVVNWLCAVLGIVSFVVLAKVEPEVKREPIGLILLVAFAFLVALSTIITALCWGVFALAGRFNPEQRGSGGLVTFIMSLLPWLGVTFCIIAYWCLRPSGPTP
jgi:hypothetical protein